MDLIKHRVIRYDPSLPVVKQGDKNQWISLGTCLITDKNTLRNFVVKQREGVMCMWHRGIVVRQHIKRRKNGEVYLAFFRAGYTYYYKYACTNEPGVYLLFQLVRFELPTDIETIAIKRRQEWLEERRKKQSQKCSKR